jgi:uncharacterized protein YecE (DUF72 family)
MNNVHVGTMGWSYDFWKGSFYPKNLASSEFLAYYSRQFDTVEVDSTFYRIPRKQTVLEWKDQTSENFLFSLKFPRIITHVKMLKNCQEETKVFLERVEFLGEKLGPLLLQFPSSFGNEQVSTLREFLKNVPKKHRYVVEVRNKKLLNDSLFSILKEYDVVLAWVQSPYMPIITEMTSNSVYVRWEGDRKKINGTLGKIELDRTGDIKLWADKLKQFWDRKIEVFGYFSKYYSGYPPSDVHEFLKIAKTKK